MTAIDSNRLPTSPYPPVPLARPLSLFGKTFAVEMSTALTFNPDTVLRAALGMSLQTVLRDEGTLGVMRQLDYALKGKHVLTSTSKSTVRRVLGPVGESLVSHLEGGPAPKELAESSDWELIGAGWKSRSGTSTLAIVVNEMIQLDLLAAAGARHLAEHGKAAAERFVIAEYGDPLPYWRPLRPDLMPRTAVLIESALKVIAVAERIGRASSPQPTNATSVVLELLRPRAKPMGHWLKEVASKVGCRNNKELSDALARRAVLLRGKLISHDTLRGWSSMKPGMLMSLYGCRAVLSIVRDEELVERLTAKFALARFLAFLCDIYYASCNAGPPPWTEAQQAVALRYAAITQAGYPAAAESAVSE